MWCLAFYSTLLVGKWDVTTEVESSLKTSWSLYQRMEDWMSLKMYLWRGPTKLDCEMLISPDTLRICRSHEGDQPHRTVKCLARLILSECYSPDLPWSWRWPTTLHWEMPSSPDSLRVLLPGFAVVVKVTNQPTNQPNWTVRCRARLILSEWSSPDLLRWWRWLITLDREMPVSSDSFHMLLAGFASLA